jgi:hypothetical protein
MNITQDEKTKFIELLNRAANRIITYANKNHRPHSGGGDERDYYTAEMETADENGIEFRCEFNGSCHCHPETDYNYITLPWEEILRD